MEEHSIRSLLQPGEQLFWEGAPERGFRLQRSDAVTIPFSLVWCGFLCLIIGPQLRLAAMVPLMGLVYVPFILAGVYLLVGRFFLRAWQLSAARYGVTDKRVILVSRRETVFLMYGQIPMLQKEIRNDGIGTIWFRPPTSCGAGKHRHRVPGVDFEEIAGAEQVYRLIERQMLNRE
nr:hypothetical protein [uncultured Oscillibacter sp.]